MKSASLKKFGELLFGELQFADVEAHRAARNGSIAVGFVEGDNLRVSVNVDEVSGSAAFLVFGWPVAKFFGYTQQLIPGDVRRELSHIQAMQTTL